MKKIAVLPERLREAREAHGLTQEALAQLAGVTRPYIVNIEAGRKQPSLDVAQRLAEGLQLPLDALVSPDLVVTDKDGHTTIIEVKRHSGSWAAEETVPYGRTFPPLLPDETSSAGAPSSETKGMQHSMEHKQDWEVIARQLADALQRQLALMEKDKDNERLRIERVDAVHADAIKLAQQNMQAVIEEMRHTHASSRSDEGSAQGAP